MLTRTTRLAAAILALAAGSLASGAGLLAPTDQTLPPLRVTDHLVDATIRDGVAITTVTQTFRNDTDRRLEATYVFPLPEDGDLTDFRMTFNGKMVQGKVLPAEEARTIYESIVRQARDPGLIEFIGRRLLQMRVFPIEPKSDTTIQVRYQQICRPMSGMTAFHYPLRTCGTAGRAYGTVRFNLDLRTTRPLKSVWSPSHAVEIVRGKDETSAKVGYEASGGSLEDDFLLLYDTDASDVGLSVVAHRATTADPGHFVLMLTPKQLWPSDGDEPQDYVFVVDTSGSMAADGKMNQAKQALRFCIDRLDEADRFSVVRFSTGFDVLFDQVSPASDGTKKKAKDWIDGFAPAGGTNIADTLAHVLGMRPKADGGRPFVVVFLTDGRGNRKPEEIFAALAKASGESRETRLFAFGVGHDVNTALLDGLADRYAGKPKYVQPGENLEIVLGDFFSIVSRPVLTNLTLSLPDVGATERFPAVLGDLYHGQSLVVAGRYVHDVKGKVTLSAQRGGERVEYTWPSVAFTANEEATYVPGIWAGRKIAYLIDQIRAHGESQEMIDEVLALSQEYGIQTPYSSWLVNPEGVVVRPGRRDAPFITAETITQQRRLLGEVPPAALTPPPGRPGGAGGGGLAGDDDLYAFGRDPQAAAKSVLETSGANAVMLAERTAGLRELRTQDESRMNPAVLAARRIDGRWYHRVDAFLVDEALSAETTVHIIKFASPAYFELVQRRPDLRKVLAAQPTVVVMAGPKTALLVAMETGIEQFSDDLRKQVPPVVR